MELGQGVELRVSAPRQSDSGYAMAALLVGMTIMAVLMGAALPVWSQHMKREREEELIWRGNQYARAVGLFQRKYANTFPPTIDILVEQRFLRKKYKDPMTDDDFQPIPAGGGVPGQAASAGQGLQPRTGGSEPMPVQGFTPQRQPATGNEGGVFGGQARPGQPAIGIQGVVSKSKDASIKIYNGRTKYNEWAFVYLATAQRLTPGGTNQPGLMPGTQPGGGPGVRPGFGPQGSQGRPPVGFPGDRPTFRPVTPGPNPFGPNSPFAPPPGLGDPRQPGPPPPRPPG
jgi:type II secretory pathway pseudopilin PulG